MIHSTKQTLIGKFNRSQNKKLGSSGLKRLLQFCHNRKLSLPLRKKRKLVYWKDNHFKYHLQFCYLYWPKLRKFITWKMVQLLQVRRLKLRSSSQQRKHAYIPNVSLLLSSIASTLFSISHRITWCKIAIQEIWNEFYFHSTRMDPSSTSTQQNLIWMDIHYSSQN